MRTSNAHRALCALGSPSLSRACFLALRGWRGAGSLLGAICRMATVTPRRGTLPVRSLRPMAVDIHELGDPAQSYGVRRDGDPRLFLYNQFQSLAENCVGTQDHSALLYLI